MIANSRFVKTFTEQACLSSGSSFPPRGDLVVQGDVPVVKCCETLNP